MSLRSIFKRWFHKKPKSRKLRFTVSFKTELEDTNDGRMILMSEPLAVNQNICYEFRNMLNHICESVSFIDQYNKTTTKIYPCTAQSRNCVIFINNPLEPKDYGKLMFIIPKIDSVDDKFLKVVAEVGNFNRCLSGAYRDFALRGQTVTFTIKYHLNAIESV
jgi:hypothetical protein